MELVFLIVRLFIAFFLTLYGIAVLVKADGEAQMLFGATVGAIGLTFIFLLWAAQRRRT